MSRLVVAILVACSVFACFCNEAESSYLGRTATKDIGSPTVIHSTLLSSGLAKLTHIQRVFRERMSELARQIGKNPSWHTVLLFLAFCSAYGVVHAAGPGHGKSVLSAYFVARGGDLKGALFFGSLLAFVHVGTAVILVLALSFFFQSSSLLSFNALAHKIYPLSYLLITLVGLVLLMKTLLGYRRSGVTHSIAWSARESNSRDIFSLALVSGIIPCPGAALILLFTLNLGILWVGLLGMIALACGMGITTTVVACASLGFRDAAFRVSSNFAEALKPAYVVVSALGAFFITAFGLFMFIGCLSLGTA